MKCLRLGLILGFFVGAWVIWRRFLQPLERPSHAGLRLDLGSAVPPRREEPVDPKEIVGYCVRCRAKRPMRQFEATTTRRGQPACRGLCAVCGARMFRMLARAKPPA